MEEFSDDHEQRQSKDLSEEMAMLNVYAAVGRLVKDAAVDKTTAGTSICRFTIAVDRDQKDASGNRPADFIQCQAWRGSADYLGCYGHKGDKVSLIGRLETGSYKNKAGNTVYTWVVNCQSVYILGPGGKQPAESNSGAQKSAVDSSAAAKTASDPDQGFDTGTPLDISSDDLPF